jgi:hypothetical protein
MMEDRQTVGGDDKASTWPGGIFEASLLFKGKKEAI